MKTIVIAPHPDDEVFGVGGTLLRRKAEGAKIAWVIVTSISTQTGWSAEKVNQRASEIQQVNDLIGFDEVFALNFPAAQLDRIAMSDLVSAISSVFKSFEPDEVFLPHYADIHSDHRVVFDAATSCTKWFRHPSIRRVLAYETLSETDAGLHPEQTFRPNVFIDVEPFLDAKLQALEVYQSELGAFPFPRSREAVRALAAVRGAAAGFNAAEAFELLRERN